MSFSEFLSSERDAARRLVDLLCERYEYASVLGADVKTSAVRADKSTSSISAGRDTECGFVVKIFKDGCFFEYSCDDLGCDVASLAEKISSLADEAFSMGLESVGASTLPDEPLEKSFRRECDLEKFSDGDRLEFCKSLAEETMAADENVLNVFSILMTLDVSKLFVSKNRTLDQHYAWVNGMLVAVYKGEEKVVRVREGVASSLMADVIRDLPAKRDVLIDKARHLATAKPITPGVYDVITDPSITGLIAHEAFGHGVEMDQFTKDRALAKEYVGKYVASPICNMKDGAASTLSAASFFFDDDGVLAGDTQIIRDGILVTGISDIASAAQLGLPPTGNGRRESTRHKAYARMTNTFFEAGRDKLEDMIASIDHGYMLFETNNGMEDPKNWAIQCTAEYGIEIVNGKLTDNYVSPVVISGYVPELLKSISMISDEVTVIGAGSCGKGYKEWVRVSDGGPALKARVKLG